MKFWSLCFCRCFRADLCGIVAPSGIDVDADPGTLTVEEQGQRIPLWNKVSHYI